jgi:hypothetical protein
MEEWRTISGYPDYQVSNQGRVKSVKFNKEIILSLNTDSKNYFSVQLCMSNITKRYWVARLVAESFIPNTNNYPEVDHIDRNRQNNTVENLRWVSRSQNCINTVRPNKLGQKYISKHTTGAGYTVQSKTFGIKKYFYTLEEAISFRDIHLPL